MTGTVTSTVTPPMKGQHAIRIPNGRLVSVGVYVEGWKRCLAASPRTLVCDWDHFPQEAERVLASFRRGMRDRINRHLPWWGKGRKWSAEYQTRLFHLNLRLIGRCVIRPTDVPKDLRARLAHRITQPWEE